MAQMNARIAVDKAIIMIDKATGTDK